MQRRAITRDTVNAVLALEFAPSQTGLVAHNARTLAQVAYEPSAHVWGLWDGDTPVGLMAMIDVGTYPHLEPGDDPQAAFLWRLMIAADQQGKGYGSKAIAEACAQARDWGLPRLATTCVDRADSALPFYHGLGFRRTGRIVDDEVELVREA